MTYLEQLGIGLAVQAILYLVKTYYWEKWVNKSHSNISEDIRQLREQVGYLSNEIGKALPLTKEQEVELREIVDGKEVLG